MEKQHEEIKRIKKKATQAFVDGFFNFVDQAVKKYLGLCLDQFEPRFDLPPNGSSSGGLFDVAPSSSQP